MTTEVIKDKKNSKAALIISIIIFALIGFISLCVVAYQHSDGSSYSVGYELGRMIGSFLSFTSLKNGIGIGTLIAVHCSWERNKSILWAILHAILGWGYVVYFALTRGNSNTSN